MLRFQVYALNTTQILVKQCWFLLLFLVVFFWFLLSTSFLLPLFTKNGKKTGMICSWQRRRVNDEDDDDDDVPTWSSSLPSHKFFRGWEGRNNQRERERDKKEWMRERGRVKFMENKKKKKEESWGWELFKFSSSESKGVRQVLFFSFSHLESSTREGRENERGKRFEKKFEGRRSKNLNNKSWSSLSEEPSFSLKFSFSLFLFFL